MKSTLKCPKCGNSSLHTARCNDGVVIVSCEHKFSDGSFCEFYVEMRPLDLFI